MEKMISIDIICSNTNKFSVRYSVLTRVVEFKNDLAELTGFPADDFRLTYKGIYLEDHQTLDYYGIKDHHAIYMELYFDPGFTMTETSPPSDTTTGGKMIMIEIIYLNGDMFSVRSSVEAKVADFKELLAEVYFVPAIEQRLIYRRHTLQDDRTLESYGISHNSHGQTQNPPDWRRARHESAISAIFQMTQTLLSNPQLREQFIDENPVVRSMFDENPELRDMIQNPEIVRCLNSPQMMQAPESQPELPRQNSIQHSIPSEDAAAGPSTSFNAVAPELQHSTPLEDVAVDSSTSLNAKGLQPQRSSDLKYQIYGWAILAASIVAWRIFKSQCTSIS